MGLFRWTVLGLAVAALFACTEVLKAGRCNQTSDCAAMQAYGAGYVCNNDLTLQGDGRCVPRLPELQRVRGRPCLRLRWPGHWALPVPGDARRRGRGWWW